MIAFDICSGKLDVDVVQQALHDMGGANLDAVNEAGETAAMVASRENNVEIVQLLNKLKDEN